MTKKIFAVVVAAMLVMALSVTAFATVVDIPANAAEGLSDALIVVNFPEGCVYNVGDKVTVHFAGSCDSDFRVWLSNGEVTMSPEPLWKASEQGVELGEFDVTVELEVGDKDNTGTTTANAILFKGAQWGVNLENFKLTTLEIVDGNDAAPAPAPEAEATPEPAPEAETTPEPAPAPAEKTPSAPKTGLALAVVPAVMALAAVAVSKKH